MQMCKSIITTFSAFFQAECMCISSVSAPVPFFASKQQADNKQIYFAMLIKKKKSDNTWQFDSDDVIVD